MDCHFLGPRKGVLGVLVFGKMGENLTFRKSPTEVGIKLGYGQRRSENLTSNWEEWPIDFNARNRNSVNRRSVDHADSYIRQWKLFCFPISQFSSLDIVLFLLKFTKCIILFTLPFNVFSELIKRYTSVQLMCNILINIFITGVLYI